MVEILDRPPRVRESGIGASVTRREDDRLLRGEGRFTDDIDPAHTLHMAVGRCPFPHARILSVNLSEALALEGVEHILVGREVVRRTQPISVLRPVPGAASLETYAMAAAVALYEGQPVVSVAAVDRYIAEDAIELIEIDYDPLPHVSDVISAMARRARPPPRASCLRTCSRRTPWARATPRRGSPRPMSSIERPLLRSTA